MKKILFFITKSNWGGAQRYVYDLATNLKGAFHVTVALGGHGPLSEKLTEFGIKVIEIPGLQRDLSFSKEILATRELAKVLLQEKPDILHVNSSKAGVLGTALGRWYRIPRIIFTAHGWAFNEDRPRLLRLTLKLIHWLTVLLSHTTIAVSNGMRAQLTWPKAQAKMVVIHPGRTIPDLKSRPDARREIAQIASGLATYQHDIWLGTIAELHPIKRLHRAIDAVSQLVNSLPTLRYVIIGDGQLRDQLLSQIQTKQLEEHVFITGSIPEAGRLIAAFNAFVLPSKSESYGYVLVEAGQAGVPVVATKTGGITDLITHEVNGLLVPVDDTAALTTALNRILTDESLAKTLACHHREKMSALSIEKMISETIAIYEGKDINQK